MNYFYELENFREGKSFKSYKIFGAHRNYKDGKEGIQFNVYAPNAKKVCIIGDFNSWNGESHEMIFYKKYGVWTKFIPDLKKGGLYKYEIYTKDGRILIKSDPYAFYSEMRPNTASIIYPLEDYKWKDEEYKNKKIRYNPYSSPINIYEVHLGSWKLKENGEFLNYRQLGDLLSDYALEMGYTHIEIMPIMEHPLDASWGYQATGYYSTTSRYGTPEDFMYFVDICHSKNIGVILDWVPGHFCKDAHGLIEFDGSNIYENDNINKANHPQWGTLNFDFEKGEVVSFLISNAYYWFDVFHIDGLRVDAVASMLYLDYGRKEGEWTRNKYGGNENLNSLDFIKNLNKIIFKDFPSALIMAEESTAWPMVTKPTYIGGLGFNFKWNMGWMNDTLKYMETDPLYRKWSHNQITFSFSYAYSENYILPLSHDEVVHGKKSLIDKMPGDYEKKFANLRAYYGYMFGHPGKKLIFMGDEFGQFIEWCYFKELEWFLLDYPMHKKLSEYIKKLNHFYINEKSLYEADCCECGLDFIDGNDYTNSVITFLRKTSQNDDFIIVICNFTPVYREDYRIGVPEEGEYLEVFNSDYEEFGGAGIKNPCAIKSDNIKWHNKRFSIKVSLPPLATIFIKKYPNEKGDGEDEKERIDSHDTCRGPRE